MQWRFVFSKLFCVIVWTSYVKLIWKQFVNSCYCQYSLRPSKFATISFLIRTKMFATYHIYSCGTTTLLSHKIIWAPLDFSLLHLNSTITTNHNTTRQKNKKIKFSLCCKILGTEGVTSSLMNLVIIQKYFCGTVVVI